MSNFLQNRSKTSADHADYGLSTDKFFIIARINLSFMVAIAFLMLDF